MSSESNATDYKLRAVVDFEDLGSVPDSQDATDLIFMIKGEPWLWEPVGCVICTDHEDGSLSFEHYDQKGRFHCMRCGTLVEVPYKLRKRWTLTIGLAERTGEEIAEDTMLFPTAMSKEEIKGLVERYLDEAEAEVKEESDEE